MFTKMIMQLEAITIDFKIYFVNQVVPFSNRLAY